MSLGSSLYGSCYGYPCIYRLKLRARRLSGANHGLIVGCLVKSLYRVHLLAYSLHRNMAVGDDQLCLTISRKAISQHSHGNIILILG